MRGWILGLIVVLGFAVLVILLQRRGDEDQPSIAAESEQTRPTTGEDSPLVSPEEEAPELLEKMGSEPTARQPLLESHDGSEEEPESLDATLIVRTISETTGVPLEGATVYVLEQEPSANPFQILEEQGEAAFDSFLEDLGKNGLGLHRITGAAGTVEYPVPSGEALVVNAEGSDLLVGKAEQPIPPLASGERREVVVRLPVGNLRYCGRVIDRGTRAPVGGASVSVIDRFGQRVLPQQTDAAGAFGVLSSDRGESERSYLVIEAEGYGPAYGELEPGHDSPARAQIFRLERAAAIVGRVIDGQGEPMTSLAIEAVIERGALLQPLPMWGPHDENPGWSGTTDEDGRFRLNGLPGCVEVQLEVHRPDDHLAPEPIVLTLSPGEERKVDIILEAPVALLGTVIDQDGRAVGNLDLWVEHANSGTPVFFQASVFEEEPFARLKTDAEGRFRMDPALPGRWHIGPPPIEYEMVISGNVWEHRRRKAPPEAKRYAPFAELIEVRPEPTEQAVVLHVQRALFLKGTVVDPDGKAVAKSWVDCRSDSFGVLDGAVSESDGSFVLGPLVTGSYFLQAQVEEGLAPSDEVHAQVGDDGIVLRLRLPGASIRGRVHVEGASLDDVALLACRRSDRRLEETFFGADADGRFEFKDLEPGVYDVIAHVDVRCGFAGGICPSTDPDSLIPIMIEEAATVRVTYKGDEPAAIVRAIRDESFVALGYIWSPGTSSILVVPPGPLTIELAPTDGIHWEPAPARWTREVMAVLGEEPEVVFP